MGGLGLWGGLWRNAGGLKEEAMRACHHDRHRHCVRREWVRVYPIPRKAEKKRAGASTTCDVLQ